MKTDKRFMNEYIKVTDFTCNGKCSNCGQCCGDILHLSKSEIKRIDDYLKRKRIKPTNRCIFVDYDNTCPFRDTENKKCKIYDVRPDICRVYQCNKSPKECVKNRELTNEGKLPRSMRNLFFNDNEGAEWLYDNFKRPVFDRKGKVVRIKDE